MMCGNLTFIFTNLSIFGSIFIELFEEKVMTWYWWVVAVLAYLLCGFGVIYALVRLDEEAGRTEEHNDGIEVQGAFFCFFLWPIVLPLLALSLAKRKK